MNANSRIFLFLCMILICSCTSTSRFYLVRHAEKENGIVNPHLTDAGRIRAIALCDSMLHKKLKVIFSTDSNRTLETAQPTATRLGLTVKRYANDTLNAFVQHLKNSKFNTLVVGHSNTLIPMLREFGLNPTMNQIGDDDFDNLFIVTRTKDSNGNISYGLTQSHYGSTSP